MKKTILYLILIALVLTVGCQSSQDLSEYENLTKEIGVKILEGDPSAIEGKLSENVLKEITEDDLKEALLTLLSGERLTEVQSVESSEQRGNIITEMKAKMTSTKGLLTIVYNTDKKIEGLFYRILQRDVAAADPGEGETTVKVGEDGALEGFLRLPKNVENPPLVIFLHGSGPQDRNETIVENTPFKDLAEDLAEGGVATLRYDKRTFAKPDTVTPEITIYQESLDDLYWILKNLDQFEGFDKKKVFVLGHSQGGMLVPKIAHDHPELKGVMMLAGSARSLVDIWYDQALAMVKEEEKADFEAMYKKMKEKKENGIFPPNYLKSLDEVEASKFLSDLNVSMLVLQGEKDFQVYFDKDYKDLQERLKDNPLVQFKSYPDLNHLFMKDSGKTGLDAYKEKGRVEKEVTKDLVDWVKSRE